MEGGSWWLYAGGANGTSGASCSRGCKWWLRALMGLDRTVPA